MRQSSPYTLSGFLIASFLREPSNLKSFTSQPTLSIYPYFYVPTGLLPVSFPLFIISRHWRFLKDLNEQMTLQTEFRLFTNVGSSIGSRHPYMSNNRMNKKSFFPEEGTGEKYIGESLWSCIIARTGRILDYSDSMEMRKKWVMTIDDPQSEKEIKI